MLMLKGPWTLGSSQGQPQLGRMCSEQVAQDCPVSPEFLRAVLKKQIFDTIKSGNSRIACLNDFHRFSSN